MSRNINILFWGDSFTNRTGVKNAVTPEKKFSTYYKESYTDILMKRLFVHFPNLNFKFYNKGISGELALNLIDRFDNTFSDKKVDIVVLLIGHNDVKKLNYNKFISSYSVLLSKLKELNNKVICLSVLPVEDNDILNEKIITFNNGIKESVNNENFIYLDIYKYFADILKMKATKKINLFEETKHLSELGNIVIADSVYDVISDLIK